jgi:hypothetical protein
LTIFATQLFAAAGLAIDVGIAVITGFRHIQYIAPESSSRAVMISVPAWIFSAWSLALVKASIAFMLLRIKQVSRWRPGLVALIAVLMLASTANTIVPLVQCRPLRAYWDPTMQRPGACWSPRTMQLASYIFSGETSTV